ncbi:NADPH dehydrogenase (quinone) [Candidatus Xenohaliotis californiensis]|uniref:NADPH dehydrogenase (Quinone) n=1 Tax=Candidatus Xenohaliotis californiensis TaxID=84677 RepID=A0ABP0ET76_9RICK|nr:NADPH dehydrogenase (quinone) [Candidatus Xenohaliotis californiensis]
MQTILLILGINPTNSSKGHYNHGLFNAAIVTLESKYHILTTAVAEDCIIEKEIDKFKQADIVIYQYPIYWYMPPAVLKEYIESVFTYNIFFTENNDGDYASGGLMNGKKFMLSTTWNSPAKAFENQKAFFSGKTPNDILLPMRKAHIYCGFKELPHFSCHNIVKKPNFDNDKERYKKHLHNILLS